jgi:lipid-A-disaccharide synthase-like uncharacterized protein
MNTFLTWLSGHFSFLVAFGLAGQALFMMRFVAQWIYSEKEGRSAMPEVFWYFSLGGGIVLLIYAIIKNDIVFIIGQATGLFIYGRNIFFIWRARIKRRGKPVEQVFDELKTISVDLAARHAKGTSVSHAERKSAHEALHILQAARKE